MKEKNILLRTDNSTVVAYINKEGGTRSLPLCRLAWEIFQWAIEYGVDLRVAHIPGKRNMIADNLSRGRKGPKLTEWVLEKGVVKEIFLTFREPNIDLLATHESKQLAVFCSPWPTKGAWASDALSVDGSGMLHIHSPHK